MFTHPMRTFAALTCAAGALAGCTDPAHLPGDAPPSGSSGANPSEAAPAEAAPAPTLQGQLDARKADFETHADNETKRIFAEGTRAVEASGVTERAKQVGDDAPSFTLPDALRREVSLSDLLAEGPVVIVWYRGGWCPYCNMTLHEYQQVLPEIERLGATLVAISPELPDKALTTKEKNELEFVVLSDRGNAVAREYGVVFKLTDDVAARYAGFFDIVEHNGDDSQELPLAATYVIDREGVIRYASLDADYTKRAEPAEVLRALRGLDR